MTPQQQLEEEWRLDPKNWIWGLFYFNKADKRIFPPKRIAWMGWTVNFANPYSILTMVAVVLFLILVLPKS